MSRPAVGLGAVSAQLAKAAAAGVSTSSGGASR